MSNPDAETSPPKGPAGIVIKFALYLFVLFLLVGFAATGGAYLVYDAVTNPGTPVRELEFDVPEGATGAQVGSLLADAGFIEHPALFRIAIRLDTASSSIKQGPYLLPMGLSPLELLDLLQEGPNRRLRPDEIPDELKVTIPEGLRLTQIADLCADPDAFLKAALAPELIDRLGIDRPTSEGFLLPDTFFFSASPTEAEIVARMADQFEEAYAALLKEFPLARDRSRLEVVTVASIVEEEARADDERPIIAAVIYNRLERDRPLEMDSTLQYALNKYGQRLLSEDKEVDSPFNTYRRRGLPPGPISNPGKASLRAAMNPAEVDYLYFVSNADGTTHTFSKTLAENYRAVARFRKEIREQRKAAEQGNSQ